MALNLHSFLCLDDIQQKDAYLPLTTAIGIMAATKGNSFGRTSKLWKHHTKHLKEMHQRKETMKFSSQSWLRAIHIAHSNQSICETEEC